MAIIGAEDQEAIRKELSEHLGGDVRMTLVGPSALSPPARDLTPQLRELLGELAALSPRLALEYLELPTPEQRTALGLAPDEGGPITLLSGAAKGKVRFLGAPSGHEFPGLLRAILDVSRGSSELSKASRDAIARISRPVHIQVFFTPT